MRLPDFLIIGSSKSGTTTLYQYLCRHPQVYMSTPKEPQFFAIDEFYARGMDWYTSLFNDAKPEQLCGEASGKYANFPQYPEATSRIAKAVPNVKLIYIMRHPVDRAYSHYVQLIKWQQMVVTNPDLASYRTPDMQLKVTETFEEAISRDRELLDISNYMMQIEQYLPLFPKESLLCLLMEDLIKRPAETLSQICQFIGIDASVDLMDDGKIVANKATDHNERLLRSRITAPFKAIPGIPQLAGLLPKSWREGAYKLLQKSSKQKFEKDYIPPEMLPETREKLLKEFIEPNQKLAEFLNRDLSHWSK
jgi:Sulfotransferase domain